MHNFLHEDDSTDLLIFGLDTGKIDKEFFIGDLKVIPNFDLQSYLKGYDDSDIGFIVDYAKYGQYRPKPESLSLSFSPMVDDVCLIPFRLFKVGWLSAMRIAPVIKTNGIETRCELNFTRHLFGQIWADYSSYKMRKREIGKIQGKYQQLSVLPKGYLEMALRRFSRCYKYIQHSEYAGTSELDDYWVDLVIALESITTRVGENITSNMARRTALLLGKGKAEQKKIKQKVREIYKQRCDIVHGNEKDKITEFNHQKRFEEAEDLRSLVRDTINACINLLTDPLLTAQKSFGERKTMAEIIDEKYHTI